MKGNILLTGSLLFFFLLDRRSGFIGSHTAVSLIASGYKVTLLDNLSNSKYLSLWCVSL